MITTIVKSFRAAKKKEWNVYQNAGVQSHTCGTERFSLIDPVLDGELNDEMVTKDEAAAFEKTNLLIRIVNWFKTKLFR